MRPPAAATMRSVKRCYPKMSKKEKRFDPSKAPIPVPMVEPPISQLFIYQNIPHRSFEYYRAGHMLILAAQCGNADEVNSLISVHQVDVNYRSLSTGQTALMHARNPKVADLLLRNGADPNLQNRMGNTALHFAVASNDFDLCQTLLLWGAQKKIKNQCGQGITPCQVQINRSVVSLIQQRKTVISDTIHWPLVFPRKAPLSDVLSIDFEMIGIVNPSWGHHVMIDFPVEVGIVDSQLNTVYHTKCRPDFLPITGPISNKAFRTTYSPPVDHFLDRPSIDLRTRITGIRPGELDSKPLASQVLAEVRQIIQGKYLVGHAIEHDLLVLQHFGPPFQGIRDTSQFLRWKGKKISLKKAAATYLSKSIQTGKHSALEDAVTTMELYLLLKEEWESQDDPFLLPPNQIRQVLKESGNNESVVTESPPEVTTESNFDFPEMAESSAAPEGFIPSQTAQAPGQATQPAKSYSNVVKKLGTENFQNLKI